MKRSHHSSLWNLRKAVSPAAIHLPADPTGSTTTKMCYLCTRFSCHPSPRSVKKGVEGVPPLECSPPARQRRAAGEVDGSDESLLSEETSAEAAWPRAKTADGGRAWARALQPEEF